MDSQPTAYNSLEAWLKGTGTRQKVLAKKARVPESTLSLLLSSQRACTIETAMRLSRVTGVPVEKLTDWSKVTRKRKSRRVSQNKTGFAA